MKNIAANVRNHLIDLKLESPILELDSDTSYDRYQAIQAHVEQMLTLLGMDTSDNSIQGTPDRVTKMFMYELFKGINYDNFPSISMFDIGDTEGDLILERDIKLQSVCEHHLLPILGFTHIAYIPNKKVVGLSKLNRIADFFARRPQVQERLTAQIRATIQFLLETEDVAVIIDAEHLCVKMRGIKDPCSSTVTSSLGGRFKTNDALRAEFLTLITLNNKR